MSKVIGNLLLTILCARSVMLYKFRICPDPDLPDTAQGWVVATSEMQARALLGEFAKFHRMPSNPAPDLPNGTILVTEGSLETSGNAAA